MADHHSLPTHDLDPSVISAVGAAYDSALQSLESEGAEVLRHSLALHLLNAAFAGERDSDRLQERGVAFVRNCLVRTGLAA
jgi:hypothetical protein